MYTLETLKAQLISLGYDSFKAAGARKIIVLVSTNRVSVLENIQKSIPNSKYDTKPTSESSVGKVLVDGFSILAKPASKQGSASAGVENEIMLVDTINKLTRTGPINVIFRGKNKTFEVLGCTEARRVGADTSGRKKADVVLIDKSNKLYPISIKKDDAEVWESADTYFGENAKRIIIKAITNNKTKLIPESSFFKIEPNIAVKATTEEKREVVFGSDIEKSGAIITKTFNSRSFKQEEDSLIIECTHIITNLSDVKDDKDVFFLIRNDKTRKSIREFPGIRVLAVYKKRINRNVIIVDR
jgi:hypothetical protein